MGWEKGKRGRGREEGRGREGREGGGGRNSLTNYRSFKASFN